MGFTWLWHREKFTDNLSNVPSAEQRGLGRPTTTWPSKPWGLLEFLAASDIGPASIYTPKPQGYKRSETIPEHPLTQENVFVISTASPPILLHTFSWHLFPQWKWSPFFTFMIYHISFVYYAHQMLQRLHYFQSIYGTFDEEHRARDMASDKKVRRLAFAIYAYLNLRVVGVIVCCYDRDVYPLDGLSLWTPIKLCLWMIVLDYYFYAYHRTCHKFDSFWFIHRGHHATKHPTPLLSVLADDIQETLEIIVLPLVTCCTVTLSFSEQWFAICYLLFVEACGHSGIRCYWTHPLMGKLLRVFGMDLAIEDHDLHHRNGKGGQNFGKATRIFDVLFGTVDQRVEVQEPRFGIEAYIWNKKN